MEIVLRELTKMDGRVLFSPSDRRTLYGRYGLPAPASNSS